MEEEAKNQVDEEQEAVLEQERVEETESQQKDIADGVENESILKEKSKKKQKSATDFSGLSDDEIYAKVETERLLKRKKKSKILTVVALCFTFVLAV